MIAHLHGRVLEFETDRLVLDVGGVGYEVRIPLSTYYALAPSRPDGLPEGDVALKIHTHVREDALELFGFFTAEEKALFERLIAVSGIGPKLAQVVLSGMAPLEVLQALAGGDVATLTRIPGIGKKTAERMVVELRDKAGEMVEEAGAERPTEGGTPAGSQTDLVLALVNLGYRQNIAERAVQKVAKELGEGASFQDLLKRALQSLSRA
ncbi:MAG: Holliday junction branch migration protein RuvA [Acidobacteriota bacterium]